MSLNNWFEKGQTTAQYMADLADLKDGFMQIYENFQVPEKDIEALQEKQTTRVIVLGEVWCGHCMLDIPILFRTLEKANIPVRVLPRDSHLELMDQYLTNEKRIIPIFIFLDEAGNELGTWGPMAPEVEKYANSFKKNFPPKEDPAYEAAFKEYATESRKRFTTDEDLWHTVYEDIVHAMK